ncbi:putative ABC transport system permease protein [Fodinibius salinus]|uniref:Putative ABC transport system permease protein n=1 Tax=Fodinibius salinus TaxID=860790 RepID=A0A5D3YP01_9BACT|nr:ABC transporter permease [Fodinibius salinus]TYP93889.1 putative ABC transport system permease protein [Fodinibius salinus]
MSKHKKNLLWLSSLRFLWKHPWHFALSILGVALGVSVVVSIDLSNSSAKKAFSLSTQAVTGKATHQITGAGENIDEEVYRTVRIDGMVKKSAPVAEGYGQIEGINRTFQIMGIDPIAEAPFRDFASQKGGIELPKFITGKNTGIIAKPVARQIGASVGDTLSVSVGGRTYSVQLAGLINAGNDRSQRALQNLLVVDVSTAQQLFNMQGQLSRIDLIIPQEDEKKIIPKIQSLLPSGSTISRSDSRSETVAQMTRAFELNLEALSMLALLVGMFLIYNTMTFSVVQRRQLIGRLRALGVTKKEILTIILKEAALIGIIGTIVGIISGLFLAKVLLKLVTQSINDLYFVLSVQELAIGFYPLAKAAVLGLGATLLASYWPAREASQAKVSTVLKRSSSESKIKGKLGILAASGLGAILLGAAILLIPNGGIAAGYSSLLFMIVGFSLVIPLIIVAIAQIFRPLLGKLNGLIGTMSVRGIVTELSRTSVAIAALVVAVSATVGVGVMVDSFRTTVVSWLEAQLQADVYIQPPSAVSRKTDTELEPRLVDLLKETEGVSRSHTVRSVDAQTNNGTDNLIAINQGPSAQKTYQLKKKKAGFWQRYTSENIVMVSEAYAYRNNVALGDSIFIETDRGRTGFQIQAINFDYASDMGAITINRRIYDQYFNDKAISGLALYAANGIEVDQLVERLRKRAEGQQEVFIRSNRGLREASIAIFDRTFTVTIVLRMLAMLVAFIGILSALMALQLERSQEHAVMRANGMTPSQLWNYVTTQTGVMGLMAGILSLPLGILMAYILVFVINLRSFGWSLQFVLSPWLLAQAVGLAFVAALLAGIYPSIKMARANPADALRNE